MGLEVKIIFDMLSFNPTLNYVIKRFFVAIILSQSRPFPLKLGHLHRRLRIHISGVTKFLTLSKSPHCDSVKKFLTHFVTPEKWPLT